MVPVFMSDPRFDEIVGKITESYPKSCVLYIDEIVNPELEQEYQTRREIIRCNRGSVSEMRLFHGTSENNIEKIASGGFDPTLNKRAAFGYGVYFAKNASYSSAYMSSVRPENHTFMFMCDVLVGNQGTLGKKDDQMIDNNVDNFIDPKIITTVYKDGAYPRYIIAFYKDAK